METCQSKDFLRDFTDFIKRKRKYTLYISFTDEYNIIDNLDVDGFVSKLEGVNQSLLEERICISAKLKFSRPDSNYNEFKQVGFQGIIPSVSEGVEQRNRQISRYLQQVKYYTEFYSTVYHFELTDIVTVECSIFILKPSAGSRRALKDKTNLNLIYDNKDTLLKEGPRTAGTEFILPDVK